MQVAHHSLVPEELHTPWAEGHSPLYVAGVGAVGAAVSWCVVVHGCCERASLPATPPVRQWPAGLPHCGHAHSLALHTTQHKVPLLTMIKGFESTRERENAREHVKG